MADRAYTTHAGDGRETLVKLTGERVEVMPIGNQQSERQMLVRAKTWIDPQHFDEAANEQPGADEQHQTERHLDDNERCARAVTDGVGRQPSATHKRSRRAMPVPANDPAA